MYSLASAMPAGAGYVTTVPCANVAQPTASSIWADNVNNIDLFINASILFYLFSSEQHAQALEKTQSTSPANSA